ncbi:MAG TPA: acyl-CoA dehydrogenase family protein [Ilumatobacter sp.]|nr:acyl-CoA dehydrogenase family protein [Ilumatobacter sp.]
MNFDMPTHDDPRRLEVRAWLDAHPDPTNAALHAAGYIVPHWPRPWGLDADPMHQLIIDDELKRAGVGRTASATNAIGVGWAAPTLLLAGSDWQKERFLPPIFAGEEIWCQLFSEPDSGSDLASLATRAERDGDEYVINGSKIWSSGAHYSQFGILIARTDPNVAKHKGISYFIVPMDTPGVTLSPIVDMTTAHSFNETHFDNVRLHEKYRVGAEGDGWRLAKVTLANERVSLSSSGSLWGTGPSMSHLLDLVRANGGLTDANERQRAAQLYMESEVLRLGRLRTLSARLQGKTPGPEASFQKIQGDEHGQEVMAFGKELAGAHGMLEGSGPSGPIPINAQAGATEVRFPRGAASQYPDVDPIWHYGYLFSPALTVGGGTFAVQRNIIAEQVLGLPREMNVEQGLTWAETRATRR